MSGKKRKRDRREADYDEKPKKSLVDYSRVSSAPTHPSQRPEVGPAGPTAAAAAVPAKMSAQMEAVVRLMAGKEERTIAQKLADSNRPTWEQYKQDNEDKLNLDGLDQKKMEEYRRELDAEREKILSRGLNHGASKKKKKKRSSSSSSDDDSSEEDRKRRKKKHKKKKKRKHRKRGDSDSESEDSDSDSSRGRRRKSKKKKKKKKSDKKDDKGSDESDGSHYRLSKFFTAGSDDDDWHGFFLVLPPTNASQVKVDNIFLSSTVSLWICRVGTK